MDKKSNSNSIFEPLLHTSKILEAFPSKFHTILKEFFRSYESVLQKKGANPQEYAPLIETFLDFVQQDLKKPFQFSPYHEAIEEPDYYTFGKELIRPLVEFSTSSLSGEENIQKIIHLLDQGENVILLGNHQIEADPHILFLMLEQSYEAFAKSIIFVAGERVLTDPLAKPFSMGCNLFCIYSKKHIDNPPEKKYEKQNHNKRTLELLAKKLSEGGRCIYVAPSGGRDRKGESGKVEVAPFDPQSIEMFYLMSKRSRKPTHFFPLSLATFSILPPPEDIQVELGEERETHSAPVHIHFGEEIDMAHFPGNAPDNKIRNRQNRAEYIHNLVCQAYQQFPIHY